MGHPRLSRIKRTEQPATSEVIVSFWLLGRWRFVTEARTGNPWQSPEWNPDLLTVISALSVSTEQSCVGLCIYHIGVIRFLHRHGGGRRQWTQKGLAKFQKVLKEKMDRSFWSLQGEGVKGAVGWRQEVDFREVVSTYPCSFRYFCVTAGPGTTFLRCWKPKEYCNEGSLGTPVWLLPVLVILCKLHPPGSFDCIIVQEKVYT